jgi:hypothetical protein
VRETATPSKPIITSESYRTHATRRRAAEMKAPGADANQQVDQPARK